MEETYNNIADEAIRRYFTTLKQTGYMGYAEVNKLILFIYLIQFLGNSFIKEEDVLLIEGIINKIKGNSCLIV